MSVSIPVVALVFGEVTPPQKDVIGVRVHLGCTNEIGSFECLLQNFDGTYSMNGSNPINVGVDGSISIGRGGNCPLIATVRVEEVSYYGTSVESYVRVRGRCWGERLFRRTIDRKWENVKGEEVVKDLIENHVGLSHQRDGIELVEDTDTTYTRLEYKNTPVFDILKFIAETADKEGVIGYDFRVAPDGKFEFFPKMSKTCLVDLTEKIEEYEYRKDIHRVRNKITVFGAAEKAKPSDKDAWTETLDINNDGVNDWVSGTSDYVELDNGVKIVGNYSIKHYNTASNYYGCLLLYLEDNITNCNEYPTIQFQMRKETSFSQACTLQLQDAWGNTANRNFDVPSDERWHFQKFGLGEKYADEWEASANFDWTQINQIAFYCYFPETGTGSFWIDNLFFNGCRWSSTQQNLESQQNYGLRELVEVDEELHSDYECQLRAKALLAYLKSPATRLTIRSTVIDYGNTPILAGDKVYVSLPNCGIEDYFRVANVEYIVDARKQTLELNLELGKEPTLLADYIYALSSETARLARTKAPR